MINLAQDLGWLTAWDYKFYSNTWRKRSMTSSQKKQRLRINKKVLRRLRDPDAESSEPEDTWELAVEALENACTDGRITDWEKNFYIGNLDRKFVSDKQRPIKRRIERKVAGTWKPRTPKPLAPVEESSDSDSPEPNLEDHERLGLKRGVEDILSKDLDTYARDKKICDSTGGRQTKPLAPVGESGDNDRPESDLQDDKRSRRREGVEEILSKDLDAYAQNKGMLDRRSGRRTTGRNLPVLNSTHTAQVISIQSYGAFVQLGDGSQYKDGLIHISRLGRGWVNSVADVVSVGEVVWVKVVEVNDETRKYSLAMHKRDGQT
jgi:hypothetical protein